MKFSKFYLIVCLLILPNLAGISQVFSNENNNLILPESEVSPGLSIIGVKGAWRETMGSPNITVAILSTGFDTTHPELINNMWINQREIPNNKIDDDNNGFIDDINGWNFVDNDKTVRRELFYWGTHMAGIIGASFNNYGIVGVSPNVTLMYVKIADNFGKNRDVDVADGIRYAVNNGAQIIVLPFILEPSELTVGLSVIDKAIEYAYDKGILLVAPALFDQKGILYYPANHTKVLAIGEIDEVARRPSIKLLSDNLDLVAPGQWINSTAPLTSSLLFSKLKINNLIIPSAIFGQIQSNGDKKGILVDIGEGTKQELLNKDINNKVVLIRLGESNYSDAFVNIETKGAIGAIFYSDHVGYNYGTVIGKIPAIQVRGEIGTELRDQLQTDETINNVSLSVNFEYSLYNIIYSGSSGAASYAAGSAALLLSKDQSLSNIELKKILTSTAVDLGKSGKDGLYGYGLLNVSAAMTYLINIKDDSLFNKEFILKSIIISTIISLGLILRFFYYKNKIIPLTNYLTSNSQIKNIINSIIPELSTLHFVLLQEEFVDDLYIQNRSEIERNIPKEIFKFKYLLHPVRLSIMKMLYENFQYTSAELRSEIDVPWGDFSTHLYSLEKKGYIFTKLEIVDNGVKKVLYLEDYGHNQFKLLQETIENMFM